jgi:AcrR family transcriptional regulator
MPATPTTPKGRRTREHILEAARRVFARDGYVNARMLDVAAEAELSLGGIYRYFENKEDLFAALVADIHEELFTASRALRADFSSDPFAALLEANFGYLAHYRANRDVMRTLVEASVVDRRFREIWWSMRSRHAERFVRALREEHGITEVGGIDTSVLATAAACMVEQAAYVWYAHGEMSGEQVPLQTAALTVSRAWHRLFFPKRAALELEPGAELDLLAAMERSDGPPGRQGPA